VRTAELIGLRPVSLPNVAAPPQTVAGEVQREVR
jgi:hypothetical protein